MFIRRVKGNESMLDPPLQQGFAGSHDCSRSLIVVVDMDIVIYTALPAV